jgi:hypothetical protein
VQSLRSTEAKNATVEDLSYAVADAQIDAAKFLASFSDAQRAGLKEYLKKISKANGELTKQSKRLEDSKNDTSAAEKIDRALSEMQASQLAMGTEMGINSERKQ